jgi:hypothetical protein
VTGLVLSVGKGVSQTEILFEPGQLLAAIDFDWCSQGRQAHHDIRGFPGQSRLEQGCPRWSACCRCVLRRAFSTLLVSIAWATLLHVSEVSPRFEPPSRRSGSPPSLGIVLPM